MSTMSRSIGGCGVSARCWSARPGSVGIGVGDRWHVDETYVKVVGRWVYLYRAVDQFGQVIDVYASARRDSEAARRFFQQASTSTGVVPFEVITDRAPTYPRVLDQLWPAAWHHRAIRQQPHRGRPQSGGVRLCSGFASRP